MDFNVSDDQRLLLDSVKKFALTVVKNAAPEIDLKEKMDPKVFKGASELGLPLDAVPAAFEGYLEGPFSHVSRALRDEQLGYACMGITHQLESATDVALALAKAPAAVQKKWFKHIASQSFATAAILGEKEGFTARDSGMGLSIDGAQTVVLLAASASCWLVKAKGHAGTVLVLTQGKPKGAELTRVSNTGYRACDAADVKVAGAEVGPDDIIAKGTEADRIWHGVLEAARLRTAAAAVGMGKAALDFAMQYGSERIQFGKPIIKFQALGQMYEEGLAAVAAARLLVLEAAFRMDAGENAGDAVRRAKAHAAKVITRVTIDAVQILGGYGFVNDYPVEKYYRDARVVETLYNRDMLDLLITNAA